MLRSKPIAASSVLVLFLVCTSGVVRQALGASHDLQIHTCADVSLGGNGFGAGVKFCTEDEECYSTVLAGSIATGASISDTFDIDSDYTFPISLGAGVSTMELFLLEGDSWCIDQISLGPAGGTLEPLQTTAIFLDLPCSTSGVDVYSDLNCTTSLQYEIAPAASSTVDLYSFTTLTCEVNAFASSDALLSLLACDVDGCDEMILSELFGEEAPGREVNEILDEGETVEWRFWLDVPPSELRLSNFGQLGDPDDEWCFSEITFESPVGETPLVVSTGDSWVDAPCLDDFEYVGNGCQEEYVFDLTAAASTNTTEGAATPAPTAAATDAEDTPAPSPGSEEEATTPAPTEEEAITPAPATTTPDTEEPSPAPSTSPEPADSADAVPVPTTNNIGEEISDQTSSAAGRFTPATAKPSSVVPRHRKRATCFWMVLLLVLLCYTLWEIRVVINKEETPSTSFKVSNNLYAFPYVSVCLYDGFGCYHPEGSTDECIESALRFSDAEYNGRVIDAIEDEQYSNCVGFDLSQFEVPEGEREGEQADVLIVMYWVVSEDPAAETEYGASVDVILGGIDDHEETTVVPYSRNLESSEEEIYDITAMTIGKTKRTFLDDDPVTSYPALTVSTTKYVVPERPYQSAVWTGADWTLPAETNTTSPAADGDPTAASLTGDDANDDATDDAAAEDDSTAAAGDAGVAYGMLYLQMAQGSYSLTEVDDIEPQILGTLLGSIGGFWELLLNNLYAFPYVSVCLYDGFGCDDPEGWADECIGSALAFSYADYDGQTIDATEDYYSNCVGFDLSQFEVPEGEREGEQEDVLIVMDWVVGEGPAAEAEYSASVDVILGGIDDHEETAVVPYSRNLGSSEEKIYDITAMTIGKTTRTFLDDDPVTSYPALTVSTTKYVVPERPDQSAVWTGSDWTSSGEISATSPASDSYPTAATDDATTDSDSTAADDDADDHYTDDATDDAATDDDSTGADDDAHVTYGILYLQIAQGSYSFTEVDDIEPEVVGTLLGSIGGFWELLLVAWAVCFVASRGERGAGGRPMMKARDFRASLKKQSSGGEPSRSKHQIPPGQKEKSPKAGGQGGELDAEGVEFDAEDVEVDAEDVEVDAEGVEFDAEDVEVDAEGVEFDAEDVEVDVEEYVAV
eukprot:g6832.t1